MPKFFQQQPIAGWGIHVKGFALGIWRMAFAWQNLTVHNGRVDWDGFRPKIIVDAVDAYAGTAAKTIPTEFDETASGTSIGYLGGTLLLGTLPIDVAAGTINGSANSVGDERWTYLEIDLPAGTAVGKLTSTTAKAVGSPSTGITVRNLSKWRRTATTWIKILRPAAFAKLDADAAP